MNEEIKYPVALTMVKGVGPTIAKRLISMFGDAKSVFFASQKKLESLPGIGKALIKEIKRNGLLEQAESEIQFLKKEGGKILYYEDEDYPSRLNECEDNPIILYQKGNIKLNTSKVIGIVGTRKMTSYGRNMLEQILVDLSKKDPNILVVSGLAYGVDGFAHRKSVELGLQTIGVVGHGLNMLYPAEHKSLANKMMNNGGVLTEFHSKSLVERKNFVARNRIIAGMCDVILVIESGERGGALFTAEFANSYNRDVCAIPGRVSDLYSCGCNKLIKRNMATLVESADDIMALMNWDKQPKIKNSIDSVLLDKLSSQERLIIEAIKTEDKIQVNQLAKRLQLPINQLSSILFEMEMKDLVLSSPGNVYSIK